MTGKARVYYYAIIGALGGLLGWAVADLILPVGHPLLRALFWGAGIGACVGATLAAVETALTLQWRRLPPVLLLGVILGGIGGAVGLVAGEIFFDLLGEPVGNLLGTDAIPRVISWAGFGLLVGAASGLAAGSLTRARNAALGGIIGGAVGGLSFEPVVRALGFDFGRGLAFPLLGLIIGILIALAQELLKDAWIMVTSGRFEGREYRLDKPQTVIGRSEASDIGLFPDRKVQAQHATIRRERGQYVVVDIGGGVALNGQPVKQHPLQNGDHITVGATSLVFRTRRRGEARQ
ncbi:MAG: FHA domain-containing protein [Deinococcus sp.]|nr:FHA domain-containing protein [Deinococcus sp.]